VGSLADAHPMGKFRYYADVTDNSTPQVLGNSLDALN